MLPEDRGFLILSTKQPVEQHGEEWVREHQTLLKSQWGVVRYL